MQELIYQILNSMRGELNWIEGRCNSFLIENTSLENSNKPLSLALLHSLIDTSRSTNNIQNDEEFRTANFLGNFTSNIYWYAKHYRELDPELIFPDVRFVHQKKRNESVSGVDFGLMSVVGPFNGDDTIIKIALFQAKEEKGTKENPYIDISHITHRKKKQSASTETPNKKTNRFFVSDDLIELISQAHKENCRIIDDRRSYIIDGILRKDMPYEHYQIEALLRAHFRGVSISKRLSRWCFYAIWRRYEEPMAATIQNVATSIHKNDNKIGSMLVSMQNKSDSLINIINSSLLIPNSEFGLEIKLGHVPSFLEYINDIENNIDFILYSKEPSAILQLDKKIENTHCVSRGLIPDYIFTPQSKPDPDSDSSFAM